MSDLRGGTVTDWLVIGWFTPDYRPLAETFAANLSQHGAPFHLFAKPKLGNGWNTLRKPSVVLEAMDTYPGRTVVLMDVDCIVKGDISPVTRITADVGLAMNARLVRLLWPMHKRITIKAASRVVVFRPTDGARAFAAEWERRCRGAGRAGDDEAAMAASYLWQRPGITYTYLDPSYSGIGPAGSVIRHDSAHNKMRPQSIGEVLKAIERRFRTGHTKAAKLDGLG